MTTPPYEQILLSGDAETLTDKQVQYFRDNPEMLDLIGDRETLGLRNLWRVLWIAAVLVAISKVLAIKFGDALDQFFFDVISDPVFEMGAALIGSVATVIFIQHQQKRQFMENMKFRAEVERRIELLNETENAPS